MSFRKVELVTNDSDDDIDMDISTMSVDIERFNRTLKSRMFKYFTANGTRRYVDVLQKLVNAYNTSYHRSIDVATGDLVRKVYEMSKFDKGYYPNWTDQVFTVVKTIKGDNQYVFRLSDGQGNIIEQRFYPQEIQKIKENLYRIERVIRSRVRRGRRQYFVKWLNYPEEYNSWIDSIQDVYTK
ncbi:uncharacterized protein LOC128961092 [Oppia nitens]|uniref:uncharacterized protein LOC128961092 n=1 Tax=Oppia nitens TaxID=1686743 RepID=UPI0023DA218C|nr:uncharacterized protein LOC128961092 [Oppia nitens]